MFLTSIEKIKFFVAEQYIRASKNLIDGMLETGNPLAILSDNEISDNELIEGLKNSSQSIILPALFCLYQGIELVIKGFVNIKDNIKIRHDSAALLYKFLIFYPEEKELSALLNKFVHSPIHFINQYKQSNNIETIKEFYNSMRYPEQKNEKVHNYDSLMNPDNENFLPQLKELNNDITLLLRLSVKLFRKLDN